MTVEVSVSNSPSIVRTEDMTPYSRWKVELEYAEKELEKFHQRAERVIRRFVDERDAAYAGQKWFNIFYANTNILESAVYAQLPKPQVTRKYIDYQDDVARVAALILQRNVTPDADDPEDTFDETLRHCVQDRLVPGLSMAWLRLETDTEEEELPPSEPGLDTEQLPLEGFATGMAPDMQPMPNDPTAALVEPEVFKRITAQRVCVDYVYWKDFVWSPCRVWEERRWTGRKVYMDRNELVERFGEDKGGKVPLNFRPQGMSGSSLSTEPRNEAIEKAVVYELWDRMDRKVYWMCKDWPELLDEEDDFLRLQGFEPHPKPMLANIANSNTTPRPDYFMIQDQYTELDVVNNRISLLVNACKVVGVYNKQAGQSVGRMLNEAVDNQLIPVDDWAIFGERGGIKGQVDWLPLDQVITAMQRLYEAREAIKGQIYELTGIADIVRGASKASETLGAQQIKAQFASVRIKKLQDEVARFASDILRLKAEIQVKHFEPEFLIARSGIMQTDDAIYAGPAMALLMSEEGFEWRIDVNADTIGQIDYAMEKQERTELLNVVSGYMAKNAGMMMDPKMGPLMIGLLKWTIAGFKNSQELEGMLDKQLDQMSKAPPTPPQPSPEQIKAQTIQQQVQMKLQQGQQKMQQDQQAHQMDMQAKAVDLQVSQQEHQQDLMAERERQAIDIDGKQVENAFKVKTYEMDRAADTAALVHELRKANIKENSALRMSALQERHAERANEAAVAKSRSQAAMRKARKPGKAS